MKKRMSLLILTCAAALCAALFMTACDNGNGSSAGTDPEPSSPVYNTKIEYNSASYEFNLLSSGTLNVAVSPDFPPFENLDGLNYVGYDIDLIKAVADELGLSVKFNTVNFDAIVPAIAAGSPADVAISGITVSDERKKEVDFSDTYYSSNLAIVVPNDSNVSKASDLKGSKVGSQSGTSGEAWAAENIIDYTSVTFTQVPDGMNAMVAGKVDAFVVDLPVAKSLIAQSFPECKIIQEIPTGEEYGIAVNKDNKGLTSAINAALKTLKSDGSIEAIESKWLSDYVA